MKTKTAPPQSPRDAFSYQQQSTDSLRLKELQGSFAIEGIHISDEQLQQHAEEFLKLKNSGEAQRRIARVLAKKR